MIFNNDVKKKIIINIHVSTYNLNVSTLRGLFYNLFYKNFNDASFSHYIRIKRNRIHQVLTKFFVST